MEELDTEIKGDPESFTATCQWLRETSANIEQAEKSYLKARGTSEGGWGGDAGDAFRDVAFQGARMAGDTVQMISGVCSAMEIHADGLRTAKAQMQQARDAAAEGPLTIVGFKIQPPGDAPAAPTPLPAGKAASPQQTQDHAAAVAAQAGYKRKVEAYNEAAGLVAKAKKTESESQHVIVRSISGVIEPIKLGLTLGDVVTGLAGTITANASKWKAVADEVKSPALPDKLAQNTTMSAAGRFQAAEIAATRRTDKAVALAKAYPTRIAAALDKHVPAWAKRTLDAKIIPSTAPTPTSTLLKGATKLGKTLPYTGLAFTVAGIGYDIHQGKDPTQAAVSGGASFLAGAASGAAIGAAFGGPIGVVGGAIIGIGVGIAVDEGWNLFD